MAGLGGSFKPKENNYIVVEALEEYALAYTEEAYEYLG